jgi:hypothetical protein
MSNVDNKATQVSEAVAVETVVRCTEVDVNGHLNNAKLVEYLEWGREEWYECHGFGYDRLEELGAITVVVNISLNYRQPCQQGDRLRSSPGRSSVGVPASPWHSESRGATAPLSPTGSSPLSLSIQTHAAPYRCQRSSPDCSLPATDPAFFDRRSHPDHRVLDHRSTSTARRC